MGVPAPVTLALVVVAMLAMALMHGYATVERIAIGVGAFELVFLLVAMLAHPGLAEMASGRGLDSHRAIRSTSCWPRPISAR